MPFVHTSPIPGCETSNLRFFTQNGLSATGKGMFRQLDQGLRLMADDETRARMRARQREFAHPDASQRILDLLTAEGGRRG